jgi:hypothetical protein
MAATAVRVHGLAETIRAFNQIDRSLAGEIRSELKKVAEPVAADARSRIGRYQGSQTATIAPVTSTRSVFVRQRQGKRGGKRADFGALQMRHLLGALYDNEDRIVRGLEQMLDRITERDF